MTKALTDRPAGPVDARRGGALQIDPARVHRCIAVVTGLLVVGAAWALVAEHQLGLVDTPVGAASRRLFHLNRERGLWAGFSSLFLLTTALTVLVATWADDAEPSMSAHARRWRLVAFTMAFVAFDEAFRFHEWIDGFLRAQFELTGFLHFAWVIPYGLAAMVLAGLMITPLSALPRRAAALLIAGGSCYVLGAAGAEMIDGQLYTIDAPVWARETEIFVEEMLEWAGVWVFFAGVLRALSGATLRMHVDPHPGSR